MAMHRPTLVKWHGQSRRIERERDGRGKGECMNGLLLIGTAQLQLLSNDFGQLFGAPRFALEKVALLLCLRGWRRPRRPLRLTRKAAPSALTPSPILRGHGQTLPAIVQLLRVAIVQ